MTDSELKILQQSIEKAMVETEALQKQYIKETGRRYVMPVGLTCYEFERKENHE